MSRQIDHHAEIDTDGLSLWATYDIEDRNGDQIVGVEQADEAAHAVLVAAAARMAGEAPADAYLRSMGWRRVAGSAWGVAGDCLRADVEPMPNPEAQRRQAARVSREEARERRQRDAARPSWQAEVRADMDSSREVEESLARRRARSAEIAESLTLGQALAPFRRADELSGVTAEGEAVPGALLDR